MSINSSPRCGSGYIKSLRSVNMINKIENIEFSILLSAIKKRHFYDFEDYAAGSLKRRIKYHCEKLGYQHISQLIPEILHDELFFESFLNRISVPVTEMFRDPQFYATLRSKIFPILRTYPSIKIWHAGCATGEEVYSMAIMLEEENLLDNCKIYATDYNEKTLETAQEGVFSMTKMKKYTENYYQSGGQHSFSDYYSAHKSGVKILPRLSKNITFAKHNLAIDQSFGQFHLILCRNVLIYFGRELQSKVFSLFHQSLLPLGFMCLGTHESMDYSRTKAHFNTIIEPQRIYRKCD